MSEVETFQLKATCKWAEKVDSDGLACEAGFAIVEISDKKPLKCPSIDAILEFW